VFHTHFHTRTRILHVSRDGWAGECRSAIPELALLVSYKHFDRKVRSLDRADRDGQAKAQAENCVPSPSYLFVSNPALQSNPVCCRRDVFNNSGVVMWNCARDIWNQSFEEGEEQGYLMHLMRGSLAQMVVFSATGRGLAEPTETLSGFKLARPTQSCGFSMEVGCMKLYLLRHLFIRT
jgi:hypothetical protein